MQPSYTEDCTHTATEADILSTTHIATEVKPCSSHILSTTHTATETVHFLPQKDHHSCLLPKVNEACNVCVETNVISIQFGTEEAAKL